MTVGQDEDCRFARSHLYIHVNSFASPIHIINIVGALKSDHTLSVLVESKFALTRTSSHSIQFLRANQTSLSSCFDSNCCQSPNKNHFAQQSTVVNHCNLHGSPSKVNANLLLVVAGESSTPMVIFYEGSGFFPAVSSMEPHTSQSVMDSCRYNLRRQFCTNHINKMT